MKPISNTDLGSRRIRVKNSGYFADGVIETSNRYTWNFRNLNLFRGIISFRIIKITKHD